MRTLKNARPQRPHAAVIEDNGAMRTAGENLNQPRRSASTLQQPPAPVAVLADNVLFDESTSGTIERGPARLSAPLMVETAESVPPLVNRNCDRSDRKDMTVGQHRPVLAIGRGPAVFLGRLRQGDQRLIFPGGRLHGRGLVTGLAEREVPGRGLCGLDTVDDQGCHVIAILVFAEDELAQRRLERESILGVLHLARMDQRLESLDAVDDGGRLVNALDLQSGGGVALNLTPTTLAPLLGVSDMVGGEHWARESVSYQAGVYQKRLHSRPVFFGVAKRLIERVDDYAGR